MAEKGRGDSSEGVTPSRSHSFGAMWASAKVSHYCVVSHIQDVRKVTAAVSVAFHFRVFLESKEIRKRALKKKCLWNWTCKENPRLSNPHWLRRL